MPTDGYKPRAKPDPALAGLRAIDLSRVLGGPYCTQILGDHGADVIKIEPPAGDETRDWGPPFHEGTASYFIGVNRNKRSIGLDLARTEGREVLLRLLEGADVLVENFRPGTMERWGLGYHEVLAERFPRLVYCRVSGFGADGPLGGYPGYDAILQAMTGLMAVNGEPEGGATRLGIPVVDLGCGLYAAIGILLALAERARSGRGQLVDAALFDTGLALGHPHLANYYLSGEEPRPLGNAHPNISPYDKFPTATCEIFLGIGNDRAFARLCQELGSPELAADPRFRSNADRVERRDALRALLVERLAGVDGEAFATRLLGLGLPAGPVLKPSAAVAHPHTAHREMVVREGDYTGTGIPVKLGRSPGGVRAAPPAYGANAREVLAEAGFDEAAVDRLLEAGVVLTERRRAGGR